MRHTIHSKRLNHSCALTLAVLLSVVLTAGCGGSAPSSTAASSGVASAPGSTATRTHPATASSSTTPGPLAFAACMRADGVPNFPDPQPGGGFDISGAQGVNPAAPSFRAAQSKCQKFMADGAVGPLSPGAHTHPSPQTLAKLLKIAQCMREHGISDFPDPRTSIPSNPGGSGVREITDFDGVILLFPDTMNLEAPAYRQALTACGAPPLGLHH